jgi:hypothetical protein
MAITYTFKVNKIEVAPVLGELENVVTRVRYDYKGVDENGIEGVFAGVTPMPEPGDADFKPLSELVEADVISWLEVHADTTHMTQRIEKQINDQLAPKYVDTPLPWNPVLETPVFGQTESEE